MIKCIASDLDGTILYNGQLSNNNYLAIKELQEKGIEFVIATGRNITEIKMLDLKDIKCYKVLINGALVVDKNYNIISASYMNKKQLDLLFSYLNEYKIGAIFYGASERYSFNSQILNESFKTDDDVFGKNFFNNMKDIKDLNEIDIDICKVEIMDGKRFDLLKKLHKEISLLGLFSVTSSHINNIEVNSLNVDKYVGLKKIMNLKHFQKEEVAIFGDSDNDYELFNNIEESYAMGNANKRIKDKAKYIIEPCYDDGFYLQVMKMLQSNK